MYILEAIYTLDERFGNEIGPLGMRTPIWAHCVCVCVCVWGGGGGGGGTPRCLY